MPETPDPLLARFIEYVQAAGETEEGEAGHALTEARALVSRHLAGSPAVPEKVEARAVIECAAELFQRKGARNGVMDLGSPDLSPFRIARDPMKAAYPILAPYVIGLA